MNIVGIDKIGVYVPPQYLDMTVLAQARGIVPEKLTIGIGQEKMAVPALYEDVVTMAANAAKMILTDEDKATIDQLIVASESAFDYSKSIATFVHELLNIQPYCKAYEMKQACYGATAGILSACDYVRLRPDRKVLVIATDIARYGLKSAGEPTQGAGAVAMLISANPKILAIEPESISYTTHQFDFWRPSYSSVAFVDGKFSTELYQQSFIEVMQRGIQLIPEKLQKLEAVIFHLPFSKMGKKALEALNQSTIEHELPLTKWSDHYEMSTQLGKVVGNIYTGSLYLSLMSLLAYDTQLKAGQTVGLFSYGSGAVSELLIGTLQEDYHQALHHSVVESMLDNRQSLTIEAYETMFEQSLPISDEVVQVPINLDNVQGFYLESIEHHQRRYNFK